MALILLRETSEGVERLLAQPGDLAPRDPAIAAIRRENASAEHRAIHDDYVADLTTACGIAAPWWASTIEAQEGLGQSRAEAIATAFDQRWAGPAAHPNVVWIIRLYWLACDKINTVLVPGRPVYPETFLLQWLIDAGETELVRLIACMPYWPIGLDEKGDWC